MTKEDGWWQEKVGGIGPIHFYVDDLFPNKFVSLCGQRGFWTTGPFFLQGNLERPKDDKRRRCGKCEEVEKWRNQLPSAEQPS